MSDNARVAVRKDRPEHRGYEAGVCRDPETLEIQLFSTVYDGTGFAFVHPDPATKSQETDLMALLDAMCEDRDELMKSIEITFHGTSRYCTGQDPDDTWFEFEWDRKFWYELKFRHYAEPRPKT